MLSAAQGAPLRRWRTLKTGGDTLLSVGLFSFGISRLERGLLSV